jgi:hypothetical protein
LVAAVGFLALSSVPASAAPYYYGHYGDRPGEGVYPSGNHACGLDGWVQPVKAVAKTYNGRTYTLRLCYKNGVGAYGRLDGAAVNDTHCSPFIIRGSAPGNKTEWAGVGETVDGNVNYAYTKVINDLNGYLASATLNCDGVIQAATAWY